MKIILTFLFVAASAVSDPFFDTLLAPFTGEVPGASLAVYKNGELFFEKSVGLADLENKIPVEPNTHFRIASMTKAFTALTALMLIDRGQLSFDTRITDLFPKFPVYGKSISVFHLLHHQSGLLDYEDLMPSEETTPILDKGVVDLLAHQDHTYFAPGTQFRYSNGGYALLAQIVETISQTSFAAFLKSQVFLPLGMFSSLAFEAGLSTVPHRAYGYSPSGSSFVRTDQSVTSSVLGDGGVYTSTRDYLFWSRFLDEPNLLSEDLALALFEPAPLSTGEATHYASGWMIDTYKGKRHQFHTGSTIGFRSAVERFPDDHLTIVFFSNRGDVTPQSFTQSAMDHLLFERRTDKPVCRALQK
ncbi:MAG: beta-lactamase family protein [Deltaproteobacteria bacterium]|nr:beta-lactamase family protein [Deltaproteobacteria bacterium]MBI3295822.1 beta-lactamase family protein [Deltaproteobacteria bacterium]